MNLLRKYTLPLIPKEYEDKGNVISPGLGTGYIKDDKDFVNKELKKCKAINLLEINKLPYRINIPKSFYNKVLFDTFSAHYYELNEVVFNKDNVPQCIIDLKSSINARTIIDPKTDLKHNIVNFNQNIYKILSELK